jgi:hypothetical protein
VEVTTESGIDATGVDVVVVTGVEALKGAIEDELTDEELKEELDTLLDETVELEAPPVRTLFTIPVRFPKSPPDG